VSGFFPSLERPPSTLPTAISVSATPPPAVDRNILWQARFRSKFPAGHTRKFLAASPSKRQWFGALEENIFSDKAEMSFIASFVFSLGLRPPPHARGLRRQGRAGQIKD
jgi:hypothetical protein